MTHKYNMDVPVLSEAFSDYKILGILADYTACSYYRVYNPLVMLKRHGADVQFTANLDVRTALKYDYVILPRQASRYIYETVKELGWQNKLLVYEIDDDLHDLEPENPAFRSFTPEYQGWIDRIQRITHGLTVTTPELKHFYSRNNQNAHVIPNYIDFSIRDWGCDVDFIDDRYQIKLLEIEKPDEWKDKFVIGYSGGTSHIGDFGEVGPELAGYLRRNPDTVFAINMDERLSDFLIDKYNIPKSQVHKIPPADFDDHPKNLFGVDVHIAPIKACQFNTCKSNLKVIEALAARANVIASNVGPYARFHHANPDCIQLVGKGPFATRGWGEAFDNLKNNPKEAKEMQKRGTDTVLRKYSLENNFLEWPRAWDKILQGCREGKVGPLPNQEKKSYISYGKIGPNDKCPLTGKKYKKSYLGAWG